jgi:hypothetical protein
LATVRIIGHWWLTSGFGKERAPKDSNGRMAPIELALPAMPRMPFLSDFGSTPSFDLKRFSHRFYALHDVSSAQFWVGRRPV